MKSISEILQEIKERVNKASPSPWWWVKDFESYEIKSGTDCVIDVASEVCRYTNNADHEFIVSAREDIPKLIKSLEFALKYLNSNDEAITAIKDFLNDKN